MEAKLDCYEPFPDQMTGAQVLHAGQRPAVKLEAMLGCHELLPDQKTDVQVLHAGQRLAVELPEVEHLRTSIRQSEWNEAAKRVCTCELASLRRRYLHCSKGFLCRCSGWQAKRAERTLHSPSGRSGPCQMRPRPVMLIPLLAGNQHDINPSCAHRRLSITFTSMALSNGEQGLQTIYGILLTSPSPGLVAS